MAVAKANVVAQLLLLMFMPVIARLYSPEAFGLAALFVAALQVISAFSSWKYEKLAPNSRTRRGAAARICVGLAFLALTSVLLVLLIGTTPSLASLWAGAADLGPLLWWLPVAVLALGLQQFATSWYVREGHLSLVSRARIVQSMGYLSAAFLCALFSLTRSGLVVATAAAWVASFLALTPGLGALMSEIRGTSAPRLLRMVRLTFAEASRTTIVGLINTVSLAAPVVLFSQVYSATEVGLYSLMMRLIGTPLTIITSSLSVSFWSRSAELVREQRYDVLRALFLKTTLALGIPACGVLLVCLVMPPLVPVLLGEEWRAAGPVLSASAPMLVGMVLFSAPNHLIVLRRQGLQVIADGLRILLIVGVVVAAHFRELPFVWAVLGVALASLVGHVTLFSIQLFVHRRIRVSGSGKRTST